MDDESLAAENAALKRKLQSKAEALLILSRELANCKRERDYFKEYIDKKQITKEPKEFIDFEVIDVLPHKNERRFVISPEVEELKKKLKAAHAELKELRKERECHSGVAWHQREELIQELEESKLRTRELASDLQALIDEKEELVTERDAYRCKVHRLNHEISILLKSKIPMDIDALIVENKYLKERFDQSLAEKEMTQQMLSKYKAMLDKKKMKGTVKLGANNTCGGLVVTHKQVQQLLEKDFSFWKTQNLELAMGDLRSLSLALLESLQDKTLALLHLRKTNKILADRVNALETELSKRSSVFPSQILLEGHSNSQMDKNLNNIVKEYKENMQATNKPEEEYTEGGIVQVPDNDEALPPYLQELVRKAMEEITLNSGACD
ncbi:coiled-coil domain-containing protein 149 isoform X2 [Cimex lectularius]|uniref:Uncharacterized protein n=1 Tax=Cimex lectularius TaxID=79782 RepID=A0A8I6RT87_CIMLE|nr:coiled-coil domain-containing protein 149 isoform X2 [Cimex lectularius]